MADIKIISPVKAGTKEIGMEWVGLTLPLAEDPIDEKESLIKLANKTKNNFQVKGVDGVIALEKAEKYEDVLFWKKYSSGNLIFPKEICELVE